MITSSSNASNGHAEFLAFLKAPGKQAIKKDAARTTLATVKKEALPVSQNFPDLTFTPRWRPMRRVKRNGQPRPSCALSQPPVTCHRSRCQPVFAPAGQPAGTVVGGYGGSGSRGNVTGEFGLGMAPLALTRPPVLIAPKDGGRARVGCAMDGLRPDRRRRDLDRGIWWRHVQGHLDQGVGNRGRCSSHWGVPVALEAWPQVALGTVAPGWSHREWLGVGLRVAEPLTQGPLLMDLWAAAPGAA